MSRIPSRRSSFTLYMRRFSLVALLSAMASFYFGWNSAIAQEDPSEESLVARKRIAVLPFGSQDQLLLTYGKPVSGMFIDALLAQGAMVVEREQLDQVIAEQLRGESGAIDPATAAEMGKILGVDRLVIGTLSEFQVDRVEIKKFGLVSTQLDRAKVTLDLRVINSTTATIEKTCQCKGGKDRPNLTAAPTPGIEISSTDWFDESWHGTLIGGATREALDKCAGKLFPFEAEVLAILSDGIVIDRGSSNGVSIDEQFQIMRRTVVDPQWTEEKVIGRGQILQVQDNRSKVQIVHLEDGMQIQKGDICVRSDKSKRGSSNQVSR